jgi:mRNA interferase MazF
MPETQQGQIWWANLPTPAGRRPVLILTRSNAIPHLTNVTVAPLTRTIRAIRSEMALSPADGVPTACAVSLDNILTIPKQLLARHIVALSPSLMSQVFAAVRFALGMPAAPLAPDST